MAHTDEQLTALAAEKRELEETCQAAEKEVSLRAPLCGMRQHSHIIN